LRGRHGYSKLTQLLSGNEFSALPASIESSIVFHELRDKEYTDTDFGKTMPFQLGTFVQRPSTDLAIQITGSSLYPLLTVATVDPVNSVYQWSYSFYEVRSWAFDIVFSSVQSGNYNRSCQKTFVHPQKSSSTACGDSAWAWFGSFSGSDKGSCQRSFGCQDINLAMLP
jgi:hypothetical protein